MILPHDRVIISRTEKETGDVTSWQVIITTGILGSLTGMIQNMQDRQAGYLVLEESEPELLLQLLYNIQENLPKEKIFELFPGNDEDGIRFLVDFINAAFGEEIILEDKTSFFLAKDIKYEFPNEMRQIFSTTDPQTRRARIEGFMLTHNFSGRHQIH